MFFDHSDPRDLKNELGSPWRGRIERGWFISQRITKITEKGPNEPFWPFLPFLGSTFVLKSPCFVRFSVRGAGKIYVYIFYEGLFSPPGYDAARLRSTAASLQAARRAWCAIAF